MGQLYRTNLFVQFEQQFSSKDNFQTLFRYAIENTSKKGFYSNFLLFQAQITTNQKHKEDNSVSN